MPNEDPSTARGGNGAATLTRRGALVLGLGAAMAGAAPALRPAGAQTAPAAFDFEWLAREARTRAAAPFVPPAPVAGPLPEGYDAHRAVRVRAARARWRAEGAPMRVLPHPAGWLFRTTVDLHDVSDGSIRPMTFSPEDFEGMPEGDFPGVAGFRLTAPLNRPDRWDEVASFLGASYFRALGRGSAYGLSARGISIDTGTGRAEEFPAFRAFWLDRRAPEGGATVSALLDGPSVAGAYRMEIRPGAETTVDVTARLFFRADVGQLGLAPLTSMFYFSPAGPGRMDDYRPAVHDSEGLRIERRDGDVLWRQLNNPARLANSWFAENGPLAFGLYQRNRGMDRFEDPEARYHRRPSLRVEPRGNWGPGHVRLVEIPTDVEAHDNIAAFWTPAAEIRAGDSLEIGYRLSWGDLPPETDGRLAIVAQTRSGLGGVAGVPPEPGTRKFAVDFEGGPLARLGAGAGLSPVVTVAGGQLVRHHLDRLESGRWRLVMDVAAAPGDVVELTAHLAGYGRKLTETWLNQWVVA